MNPLCRDMFWPEGSFRMKLFWLSILCLFVYLPLHTDISVLVAVMMLAALLGARGQAASDPIGVLPKIALGGFLLYACVAVLTSFVHPESRSEVLRVFLWAACILSGLLLARVRPRHGYLFLYALAAGIVVSLVLGLLLWKTGSNWDIWHDGRLKLFSRHPSRLALYCAAGLFFCTASLGMGARRIRTWISLALALLFGVMLFLTNTRAMILMLPIGLFCLLFCLPRRVWRYALAGVLIVCALAAAATWAGRDTFTGKRLISAVSNVRQDPNFRSRLPIWLIGWESFRASPLIGNGVNSYGRLHAAYLQQHKDMLEREYPGYELRVKHAHNIILGRMVDTGLIGAAGFWLFYGGAMVCALRCRRQDRWVFAMLAYYLAIGMFDDPLFRTNDAFVLFLAGAALGLPQKNETDA